MLSEGDPIPVSSTVVRYVGFGKMAKDADDNIIGPAFTAFVMRSGEDYLSVSWCQFYSGSVEEQMGCAIEDLRSSLNVKPKGCFCVAEVEKLKQDADLFSASLATFFHPMDENPSHAGIYGIGTDNRQLQDYVARKSWRRFLTKENADALPSGDCKTANFD